MTDRELLELAAKAAGLFLVGYDELNEKGIAATEMPIKNLPVSWNPLANDGDALRLAVKLRVKVRFNSALNQGIAWHYGKEYVVNAEEHNSDPYAATRRAIVRAAAEIGRNMK